MLIGLAWNYTPIVGVVHQPFTGVTTLGIVGVGVWGLQQVSRADHAQLSFVTTNNDDSSILLQALKAAGAARYTRIVSHS